jgi:N-acetylglucosamine kinase-like BadF-type ATPase
MTDSKSFVLRPSSLVIGIDGGGTHTRARLANKHGETLGNGEAGTANPYAHGFDAAKQEISLAIQRAFHDAHIEQQIVQGMCMGVAGADRPGERLEFETWASETITEKIQVINDGEIVLAAGSPENWGVALIAGTGSIAWGKSRAGQVARAGGWGYLIGDEGSGFNLAQEGLRAAMQSADGRGQETRLLAAFLEHWELSQAMELIPRVYRSGLKPADIAHFASIVTDVAQAGDKVAQQLVTRAGEELARTVLAVVKRLDLGREPIPLAMTGGLLLSAELVRQRLLEALNANGNKFLPELVHEPVIGAVRIASRL